MHRISTITTKAIVSGLLVWTASCLAAVEHNTEDFTLQRVTNGLNIPWGLAFIDPQTLLVTQRQGDAVLVDVTTGRKQSLTGLPEVYAKGQGGLLDVATAPGYPDSDWLYFTYSKPVPEGGATALARAKLRGTTLAQWQELLLTRSASKAGRHFGSRIAFDDQGHLFFSIGDRANRPNGQDRSTHAGSILRLKLDGSLPGDNPFTQQSGLLPEIWSYGHRNPQGLVYDSQRQRLWSVEHGPRGGDELNLISKGKNYGWAVVSKGKEYWNPLYVGEARQKEGMEEPIKSWTPSISPGSLLLYTGSAFPHWQGNLFAGALSGQQLARLTLDEAGRVIDEEQLLIELGQRIRSLAQGPDGLLYLGTDNGELYRLLPR